MLTNQRHKIVQADAFKNNGKKYVLLNFSFRIVNKQDINLSKRSVQALHYISLLLVDTAAPENQDISQFIIDKTRIFFNTLANGT